MDDIEKEFLEGLRGFYAPDHADIIGEIARLTWAMYRDSNKAVEFMTRHHPLLDGHAPLSMACESTEKARIVLALVKAADAGVAV